MASPVNRSLEGQSEPAASQSSDSNASEQGSGPDGFVYRPDILSEPEEKTLVEILAALDYEEIKMHGVVARRAARRYGFGYDYNRRSAVPGGAEPLPSWLLSLRERCGEALTGTSGEEFVQALVQCYPPGAPIGWHRDSPSYDMIIGVSLLAVARLRFRRGAAKDREYHEMRLEPRSGYLLSGPARWEWEHHIPPTQSLRYSITLRSLSETFDKAQCQ
jgi:alkylated DNA repair protein (DNA oxidative demethylase)